MIRELSFELFHNTYVLASQHTMLLISQWVYLQHNQDLGRAYINVKFHFSVYGLSFEETKFLQSKANCEIYTYAQF